MNQKRYTREFKLNLCRSIENGSTSKSKVCRENALSDSMVVRWLAQYRTKGEDAFTGDTWRPDVDSSEAKIRELEGALGRLHMENELLRQALAKKGSRPPSDAK